MRCAAAAAAALAVAVLTGCGGSSGDRVDAATLRSRVLLPRDVGSRYTQFDFGKQVRADAHPGPRRSPTRFGRIGGWKARYRLAGATAATRGALVVESRADAFDSDGGAQDDVAAYADEWKQTTRTAGATSTTFPPVSGLGDDARALNLMQGTAKNGVRTIVVAWRRGPVSASVAASGTAAGLDLADVEKLARKQDVRMRAAD